MKKNLLILGTGLIIFLAGLFIEHEFTLIRHTSNDMPAEKTKKIKYWGDPMMPEYKSDKPGKSPMGMDLVPVYEGEEEFAQSEPGEINIPPDKVHRIGVRYDEVKEMPLKKIIRTIATIDYDERKIAHIHSKIEGWIEKLYVNTTGKEIKKGEILLDIYSPELVSAQEEYLLALGAKSGEIIHSARRRLKYWDISDEQIEAIEKNRAPEKTLSLHSRTNGVVIEKMAVEGQRIMPGEKLFTVADLSNIWLYGEVYEYELSLVKIGQEVRVNINSYPGETFLARVVYIYPYLNTETRTIKVRMEMPNPNLKFKPGMYANIELETVISPKTIAVPEDAVIDTGQRQAVILDLGGGRFKVLEVKLGLKGEGYYQILSGLTAGQRVVTSANFLIDSESSFRSVTQNMLGMKHEKKEEGTEAQSKKEEHTGHEDMSGMKMEGGK